MDSATRLKVLRFILVADAIVLVCLGVLLIVAAQRMFNWFGMPGMPQGANYLAGMWGALMATMGLGYALASREPAASQAWVTIGIIRAVLEVGVSAAYLVGGMVTMQNSALGMLLALWFALAYIVFYPKQAPHQLGSADQSSRGAAG